MNTLSENFIFSKTVRLNMKPCSGIDSLLYANFLKFSRTQFEQNQNSNVTVNNQLSRSSLSSFLAD
ncbi:hypothetical protein LEP1GSC035_3963 [Leptospira noguchii str. 2007001578]|uniref:Uncharacterized protein n=1 Tax=Leptospira noguchii str. 2007001578 TaxID=1049974 RepID=A0ABN0J020_9LEPT|nr:hypothetical protein LEP1GSC035_3963 [Leptospira noguchii str. 2007001578]